MAEDKTQEEYTEELASQWLEAKEAEQGWNDRRKAIEAKLEALNTVEVKPDGSKTNNVGRFKIKTKGRIYKSVDRDKYEAILGELPDEFRDVCRADYKPRKSRLKELREADPELFRKVIDCITSKPGSTGFTITTVDE